MKTVFDIIHIFEDYFKIKLPSVNYEGYAKQLKPIPIEALDDIATDIINSKNRIPSNFPTVNTILEHWAIWKSKHPDRLAQRQRTPCASCNGTGELHFLEYSGGYAYVMCARCGDCENCFIALPVTSIIRRLTVKEIKARPGFKCMD